MYKLYPYYINTTYPCHILHHHIISHFNLPNSTSDLWCQDLDINKVMPRFTTVEPRPGILGNQP